MTDIPIHESRQERYGKTEKKTITLPNEGIEAVQNYAKEQGLYFSVALESLALMSLGRSTAETLPRLVANLLERTINRQFNRFARLLSQAVIAVEEVNYKADTLLLQTIWREARWDPANFVENVTVRVDPAAKLDFRARQLRDDICAAAHETAVARLKQALGEEVQLLAKEAAGADE